MRLFKYICVSIVVFFIFNNVLKPLAEKCPQLKLGYYLKQTAISKNDNNKPTPMETSSYSWESLDENQRTCLTPLVDKWKKLDYAHRAKWIKVASRLESQPSFVKRSAQEKMYLWINLSVSEKMLARSYFEKAKEIDRKVISEYWLDYQKLPESQKSELAAHSIGNPGATNSLHQ